MLGKHTPKLDDLSEIRPNNSADPIPRQTIERLAELGYTLECTEHAYALVHVENNATVAVVGNDERGAACLYWVAWGISIERRSTDYTTMKTLAEEVGLVNDA